jgi:serine/threonine-protein kinase
VVIWGVMRPAPQPVARLTVPVPANDELITGALPAIALSPNGSTIVYRALREGTLQLFRRSLEEAAPHALAGSVNAMAPFFSPDGAWVGFDRDGVLFKVPVDGGPAVRICATGGASVTASWSERGDIVFAPINGLGLFRVSAGGGSPTALTQVDDARGERQHRFPEVLPGGRAAVFSIDRGESALIAAVRLETGQIVPLTEGRQALYAPSGHLLVVRGDTVWAAPFDPERLAMRGEPAPVLRGLDPTGAAHIAMARNGSLLYIPPLDQTPGRAVVWIDRQGRERPSGIAPNRYLRHSLSPDGTRVALVLSDVHGEDIWVHDFPTGAMTRLTFDPAVDTAPVWTPDGRAIVFRSDRERGGLFWISADGTGRPKQLTVARGPFHTPYAVTPDGKGLLYTEFRSYSDQGIGRLDLVSGQAVTIIDDPSYAELRPALSPDGRWLAYQANESGTFEVYLRPFPKVTAGKWRVSTGGGRSPQWEPGGRELFYFEGDSLVRVPVSIGEQPAVGSPQRLFTVKLFGERLGPLYSVAPDGSSFLVMKDDEQRDRVGLRRQLLLVQNWVSELATLVPNSR